MQNISNTRDRLDAVFFPDGVNSYLSPDILKDTEIRWAINAANAGGIWQTRPGYKSKYAFCGYTGHPQMGTIFQPTGDLAYMVVAIAGKIYALKTDGNGGFSNPIWLSGLSFNANADQIFWCKTVKAADLGPDGVIRPVTPRNVLMFQDSFGKAGYWDGSSHGHLNPGVLYTVDGGGNTIYAQGQNQTPIGSVMSWSGNRLWVAVGNKVIASNINDPFYFTECQDLTLVPFYLFESEVTAMADRGTSGRNESSVFVWTNNTTSTLRSGILNRTLWQSTADFQKKIFSGVGCVGAKAWVIHEGLLYWYASDGVVRFDSIDTVNATQELPAIDQAMQFSKVRMAPIRKDICAASRGPYVMFSVPVGPTTDGRIYNGQTQVLDRDVIDLPGAQTEAWQGIWTGIRPIEWATGEIDGVERIFAVSYDSDSKVRVWEALQGNRADNGHAIPWMIVTKHHSSGSVMDRSIFRFFNVRLTAIVGPVRMRGYWKGTVGIYKKLMEQPIEATVGSIMVPGLSDPFLFNSVGESFQPQSRFLISPEVKTSTACSAMKVESDKPDQTDFSFSLMLRFLGRAAVKAYRINVDSDVDKTGGQVTPPETGLHILRQGLSEPGITGVCPQFVPGGAVSPEDSILADSPPYEALMPEHQGFPTLEEELYACPTDEDCG